jgi:rod shape determining protein RodA
MVFFRKNLGDFFKENLLGFGALFILIFLGNLNQWIMSETSGIFLKNLLWHLIGLTIFIFITFFTDYRKIPFKMIWYAYLFLIFVLFVMCLFKKRWLHLGPISIQPSEFLKPILLLLISSLIASEPDYSLNTKLLLKIFVIIAIPLMLILPTDLDYAFIMGVMFFSFLLFIGIPRKILIILSILGVIFCLIVVPVGWKRLKPHQRGRIYGYLHPEKYAKTWGYQLNQALIAIGYGGIYGHGFKKGWSTRLNYLPAKHTDLAFAVWAETWGLIGVSLFLVIYGYLLLFGIQISSTAKDWMGKYLSLGITLVFLWQLIFNVGGCSGLLPMTSIPLPFLSYGGSITISSYFLLSLLFNIGLKRYFFK